jgi:6-phosphogluconolactonase
VQHELRLLDSEESLADAAAHALLDFARLAVNSKGHFNLAVGGGRTPRAMFEDLAARPMPWAQTVIYQVDERLVGPDGSLRNLKMLRECLPKAAVS